MSEHYKKRGRESIEIIKESLSEEAFKGFLLGNVYKYLNRYEYKGDPQGDLYKAATYIYALIGVLDNPQIENPFKSHILDESPAEYLIIPKSKIHSKATFSTNQLRVALGGAFVLAVVMAWTAVSVIAPLTMT